jgi:hypothetical protein
MQEASLAIDNAATQMGLPRQAMCVDCVIRATTRISTTRLAGANPCEGVRGQAEQ